MSASRRTLLFLLGPPGAGKTTQGALLAAAIGGRHVSAGELVRQAVRAGEPIPRERDGAGRAALADGAWLVNRMEQASGDAGLVIIDGFPRSARHLGLAKTLGAPKGAIRIQINLDEAIDRMRSRGRDGEDLARIAHRWNIHRNRETSLSAAFEAAGLGVVDVDAQGAPSEVAARVMAAAATMLQL